MHLSHLLGVLQQTTGPLWALDSHLGNLPCLLRFREWLDGLLSVGDVVSTEGRTPSSCVLSCCPRLLLHRAWQVATLPSMVPVTLLLHMHSMASEVLLMSWLVSCLALHPERKFMRSGRTYLSSSLQFPPPSRSRLTHRGHSASICGTMGGRTEGRKAGGGREEGMRWNPAFSSLWDRRSTVQKLCLPDTCWTGQLCASSSEKILPLLRISSGHRLPAHSPPPPVCAQGMQAHLAKAKHN